MTSQPGQQTITKRILSNISSSKGNQTMKFGQLMRYNMTNISSGKLYTKCGGENSPSPFYKTSNLSISFDQLPEMLYSLFLLYVQVVVYQNILKLRC